MSVWRSAEPSTVALREMADIGAQRMLPDAGRQATRAAITVNMLLWRQLGGTPVIAAQLGFVERFGAEERSRIRDTMLHLFDTCHRKPDEQKVDTSASVWPAECQAAVARALERARLGRVLLLPRLDDAVTPGHASVFS